MSIYYLPWGDENMASSRLRVYLPGQFIKDSFIGVPEKYEKGDVLIIQKTPDREAMRKAQNEGAKVLYDIDDHYWDKSEFRIMVSKADLITVDTEEKKKYLPGAIVIPDCLDWDGVSREGKGIQNLIGWTGYGNAAHYLKDLNLPKQYTLRLVTTADWVQDLPDPESKVQSRPWSLDMVDYYLSECEMMIIPLPKGDFENVKGMHKLLKAWANRIPCYTSRMPDYVKAMKEAGVGEKYLVDDWSKLKNIGFDEKCFKYAMKYKAELISQLWQNVIEKVTEEK